jgi:hypothetical protein
VLFKEKKQVLEKRKQAKQFFAFFASPFANQTATI